MIGVYVTTFVLLAGFSAVLVAAGHGVGPVGILMVMGDAAPWYFGMALGWPGWALILGSLALSLGVLSPSRPTSWLSLHFLPSCVTRTTVATRNGTEVMRVKERSSVFETNTHHDMTTRASP